MVPAVKNDNSVAKSMRKACGSGLCVWSGLYDVCGGELCDVCGVGWCGE